MFNKRAPASNDVVLKSNGNLIIRSFIKSVFDDLSVSFPDYKFGRDDSKYLLCRYDNEGISVLTQTLPALGKFVEKALITGCRLEISPTLNLRLRGSSHLPKFMNRFFQDLFTDEGYCRWAFLERDSFTTDETLAVYCRECGAYRALRQVTMAFSKLEDSNMDAEIADEAIKAFIARVTTEHLPTLDDLVSGVVKDARHQLETAFKPKTGSDTRIPSNLYSKVLSEEGDWHQDVMVGRYREVFGREDRTSLCEPFCIMGFIAHGEARPWGRR